MSRLLPVFAAAATGILVGLAIVATRFVLDQTQPASLALMRYTIGVCCLAPALWASARVRFIRRDILPIMFLGTFQFGVLIVLMNHGLKYIPSARAALIFATMPFLTLILSALAGREKLRLTQAAGVALTILGVGLALGDKAALDVLSSAWLGDLAVFGSALCGASCSVLYQPYLQKYPTLQVSFLAMAASVLFLILPAGWEGLFNSFPSITPAGWAAVVFIGLTSGAGYYLWLWALNHTTPTRVTIFLGLSPLTAAFCGALFLGERITPALLLGLALFLGGLWTAHRPEKGSYDR